MVPLSSLPALLDVCDGVMLDVKAWDSAVHRALTGSDNAPVKENLALLSRLGKLTELRVVCAEGDVDVEAVLDGAAQVLGDAVSSAGSSSLPSAPTVCGGAGRDGPPPSRSACMPGGFAPLKAGLPGDRPALSCAAGGLVLK